jgi:hypothetical protein
LHHGGGTINGTPAEAYLASVVLYDQSGRRVLANNPVLGESMRVFG